MTQKPSPKRTVLRMVLFSLFIALGIGTASAQVQKYRGHILEVDSKEKTLTIDHKKKGKLTLKSNDETRVPGPNDITTLKPGMYVINIMNEKDVEIIAIIRHQPDLDKKEDEKEDAKEDK